MPAGEGVLKVSAALGDGGGGLEMGRRGVLPTAAPLRALSRSTSCSQRTWSCPCPTWHFLPRAGGTTEIEMGALRGCGDRHRSECTMGMEMGASRAWEQGHRGVDGTTGMDRDVEGLGTPWAWRWWHQGAGEGDIEGWRGEWPGWSWRQHWAGGIPRSGAPWGVGSGHQDRGALRTRCFLWQPLPIQRLPASVVWLGLQPRPGVWPHILTAASLSLESLQEWVEQG